MSTKPITSSKR